LIDNGKAAVILTSGFFLGLLFHPEYLGFETMLFVKMDVIVVVYEHIQPDMR
jgi:hypothetical protein